MTVRSLTSSMARRSAGRLAVLVVLLTLYGFTRLPEPPAEERAALASRFAFVESLLPDVPTTPARVVRDVHPSLDHISAWISSVGASVALHDVDGDGLSNDVCYVDVRRDHVIVAPVPGTPSRYAPFVLEADPLPYDAATTAPMGCLPGDLNADGFTDVLVYYWGRTPVAFLHAGAPGPPSASTYVRQDIVPQQTDRRSGTASDAVSGGPRWFTNAATRADLDGDGQVDLVIGNYFQDGARILDRHASGVEQMQHSMSRAMNGGHNRILRRVAATPAPTPSVTFVDEGVLPPFVARGWTLALGAADLDGDALPELYFANDFGPDRLLHNRSTPGRLQFTLLEGRETLTTPSSKVVGRDSFKGMGVDFGDVNGDGWLDVYVSNIAAEFALEESHFVYVSTGDVGLMRDGVAPYVDRSEPLGLSRSDWGWESRLADFDNDGVLEAIQATGFVKGDAGRWPELQELATGNDELLSDPRAWPRIQPGDDLSGHRHNPFFVRAASGRYVDLAADLGIDRPYVSRGIATADVDGDGDLDVAVANQWEPSVFYRNDAPGAGASLGLRLLRTGHPGGRARVASGVATGLDDAHPAIGASVAVRLPDGRRVTTHVDGGNGHSGARSPDVHLGLGASDGPVPVEIRWRDVTGRVHDAVVHLPPGRHTVLLGATE